MIKLSRDGAIINDLSWCAIRCSGKSYSSSCIVKARSGCSTNGWQAISSWVKCTTEICAVSCLANYDILTTSRINLKTSWIGCFVESSEIEARVLDICTAISSGTLTSRSTQRARSAVWTRRACSVCHGWYDSSPIRRHSNFNK